MAKYKNAYFILLS